jgi:hypothetical protein
MTVLCPGCRRAMRVPPEKEDVPNLRARCSGCGTVFAVAEASLALAPAAPQPQVPPPPVPPPPASSARAATPAVSARPATPARPGPPPPRPARGASWRRCATHADRPSEAVCTTCGKGWCPDCLRRQGTAVICASCDALCVTVADREAKEARARQRARPLTDEIGTVLRYPFTDATAFVAFAVVVGVFSTLASIAAFGGGFGILFSQGLLYAYAFTAINRVSAGDMDGFMPEISDMADLAGPLRVGVAALLVSSGPLLALTFLYPPSDVAQALGVGRASALVAPTPAPSAEPTLSPAVAALTEDDSDGSGDHGAAPPADSDEAADAADAAAAGREEPLVPAWAFGAFALALLWKLVYSPIAFVAGGISRSFLKTLNPVVGLDAIRRMGPTYWTAMGLYTAIAVVEFALGLLLGLVPFVGGFLRAFVQSYTFLAVGCLLGLAVLKKAPELGLD